MKKLLLCSLCFLALQTGSCSYGTLEFQAESTKGKIRNSSSVTLEDVVWFGTEFGDIAPGKTSEKIVEEHGIDFVYFRANGKNYKTWNVGRCKELRSNDLFRFTDEILVSLRDTRDTVITDKPSISIIDIRDTVITDAKDTLITIVKDTTFTIVKDTVISDIIIQLGAAR